MIIIDKKPLATWVTWITILIILCISHGKNIITDRPIHIYMHACRNSEMTFSISLGFLHYKQYVCLFVWNLLSKSRIFSHMETSPLLVKGSKFRPMLWPLSSEGSLTSLACHNYCDTGHPFIMVISVTLTPIAERLAKELSLPVFTTWVCRCSDSNTNLPLAGRTL